MELKGYSNPGSWSVDKIYCDGVGNTIKYSDCDTWFEFCFKLTTPSQENQPCAYSKKTYVLAGDALVFPNNGKEIGVNMTNPMQFRLPGKWTVSEIFSCYTALITLEPRSPRA